MLWRPADVFGCPGSGDLWTPNIPGDADGDPTWRVRLRDADGNLAWCVRCALWTKTPPFRDFCGFRLPSVGCLSGKHLLKGVCFRLFVERIMNRGDFVQFASRSPLLPRSSKRPLRLACVALSCERLFRLVHVVLISRVPLCSRAPSPCPYRERPRVPQSGKCLPAPRFALRHVSHILYVPPVPLASAHLGWPAPGRGSLKKSSLVFCRSSAMSGAGFPPPPIRAFRVRKMTGGIRVFSSPRTESTLH